MSKYIKVSNYSAFIGFFLVGYKLNGISKELKSPNISVLQSYTIQIPDAATDISFGSFMYEDFTGHVLLSRDAFKTPENACYKLYGTIFNPSCKKVPCNGVGGGNPDTPNPPCCCCCCCRQSNNVLQ